MKKDPKIFLHHILESIEKIENHLRGFSEEQFSRDIKTQDAVVRRKGKIHANFPYTAV